MPDDHREMGKTHVFDMISLISITKTKGNKRLIMFSPIVMLLISDIKSQEVRSLARISALDERPGDLLVNSDRLILVHTGRQLDVIFRTDVCTFSASMEQRAVIRFLTLKTLKSKAILAELESVYGDAVPALATVKK
jgi:hypothetical protein